MSERIQPIHRQRRAVVYVRQSTPQQVRLHLESQRLQYQLVEKAKALGWTEVEVIDEDLGRSGASASERPGFQRLVAAVCLGEVGAVFSLEASRLARNNRDWYQLLDLCGLVGTLIVDLEGVYDPALLNDRLLLGLKGTMSEFELGLFRQRSLAALRAMAERGELLTTVPIGYVRTPDHRIEKDPDRRIQHAIHLAFLKFEECGSVRQTLLWFQQEGIDFPVVAYGPDGRGVVWRLPNYSSLLRVLTNPIYAGAYAYGRTVTRTTVVEGRGHKVKGHRLAQEAWEVLIQDHHPGYIDWATYTRNQQRIRHNAAMKGAMVRGPARGGAALAVGLLRCARCGRRLKVHYGGIGGRVARYVCTGGHWHYERRCCLSFGGLAFDRALEREVLRVLEPAALEAARRLAAEQASAMDERRRAVEFACQQARYEADLARRRYEAVDPANRLVAAELEHRWNQALQHLAELEARGRSLEATPGWLPIQESSTGWRSCSRHCGGIRPWTCA